MSIANQTVALLPGKVLEKFDIQRCHTDDDRIPIQEWLDSLDTRTRARVRVHIDRMEDGNFGDVKPIGNGVSETRLNFGPGYRIYFAMQGKVIHLLNGGKKSTQDSDIKYAKDFWNSHG
jgi:putative addiction module killer protein